MQGLCRAEYLTRMGTDSSEAPLNSKPFLLFSKFWLHSFSAMIWVNTVLDGILLQPGGTALEKISGLTGHGGSYL